MKYKIGDILYSDISNALALVLDKHNNEYIIKNLITNEEQTSPKNFIDNHPHVKLASPAHRVIYG